MSIQKAVILLAGTGSRLKPITDSMHKALIPIAGLPILQHQIQSLQAIGVTDFHLVLGHRAHDIQNFITNLFSQNDSLKCFFHTATDYLSTNNACSLHCALDHIKDDAFILMDGDVILDRDILEELRQHSDKTLFIVDDDKSKLDEEAMKILLNDSGHIDKISKTIPVQSSCGESIGVAAFQKAWTRQLYQHFDQALTIPANTQLYYEDLIQMILNQNTILQPLHIMRTNGRKWVEIDDHHDLKRAQEMFAEVF